MECYINQLSNVGPLTTTPAAPMPQPRRSKTRTAAHRVGIRREGRNFLKSSRCQSSNEHHSGLVVGAARFIMTVPMASNVCRRMRQRLVVQPPHPRGGCPNDATLAVARRRVPNLKGDFAPPSLPLPRFNLNAGPTCWADVVFCRQEKTQSPLGRGCGSASALWNSSPSGTAPLVRLQRTPKRT